MSYANSVHCFHFVSFSVFFNRAVNTYAQRAHKTYPGTPVILGSIPTSLKCIARYYYWSDKARRSVLPNTKADLLIFGNARAGSGHLDSFP